MNDKLDKSIKKYNELKKTERGKAIIKLIRYFIFIFILIIVLIISGTGKTNNKASQNVKKESYESKVDITYKDKQEKLYTDNYDFKYVITGEFNVKYTGSFNDDIIEGYKEDESGIIKYKVVEGVSYRDNAGETIIYEGLYEGLDSSLFNFESLFGYLNSNKAKIIEKDNSKEYYYENINGYNYSVLIDDKHINEIVVENGSLKYDFSFKY